MLQNIVNQVRVVTKVVGELLEIGHRALPEARIVGRDHVVAIGEDKDQVAEHGR